jgi:SWI/SNF-related matrix-associated actin-dependent regulator of chromatin subfamily A3
VYHGQNRLDVDSLSNYDVIITTYHTVSNLWRQRQRDAANPQDSIFSLQWHRVVLDEGEFVYSITTHSMLSRKAHVIQNRRSHLAQSCCAIRSDRRWAISGTPIQNKLSDFLSIIKFLKVYPYSEDGVFEEDIFKPWQRGDPQGFLRLKTLVRNITISRTKAVVHLPTRIDEIHHLDFSIEERQKYECAKQETVALLEAAISSRSERTRTCNALERLNFLRLICNHGLLTQARQLLRRDRTPEDVLIRWTETTVEETFPDSSWISTNSCSNCGVDILENIFSDPQFPDIGLQASHPSRTLCEGCYAHFSNISSTEIFFNQYLQYQDLPATIDEDLDTAMADQYETNKIHSMSTKIKALVANLAQHYENEKR